jgi:hypothetical protein
MSFNFFTGALLFLFSVSLSSSTERFVTTILLLLLKESLEEGLVVGRGASGGF